MRLLKFVSAGLSVALLFSSYAGHADRFGGWLDLPGDTMNTIIIVIAGVLLCDLQVKALASSISHPCLLWAKLEESGSSFRVRYKVKLCGSRWLWWFVLGPSRVVKMAAHAGPVELGGQLTFHDWAPRERLGDVSVEFSKEITAEQAVDISTLSNGTIHLDSFGADVGGWRVCGANVDGHIEVPLAVAQAAERASA